MNITLTYTIQQGIELYASQDAKGPDGQKPFTARYGANRFAATSLMPKKSVCDTVNQLGIQKKHWSYELLLRIKHRFGISAETFLYRLEDLDLIDPALVEPLKEKIYDHYDKTTFGEPDFSRRLLTPNGRLLVFFLHMILMDSDSNHAMCFGHTVVFTETGCETLSQRPLDLVVK